MKKSVILIALLLFVVIIPGMPCNPDTGLVSPFDVENIVNAKAPDFTLRDINGRDVSLSSYRGKIVLLNFWATWCPPCKAEMPSLAKLYREMKPKGLEVIAVSMDSSIGVLRDYITKNSFDFAVLFDEGRTAVRKYKVFTVPTTFLIDRKGIIREKFFGEYDWSSPEMRQKINSL